MTHREAVKRITHWLRNSSRCSIVASELSTACHETPDCIGWHGPGNSILVECKVSRSDFLADKNKSFRKYEDSGLGDFRYYAAPPGIIGTDDLPDGWGLVEIREHGIYTQREPERKKKAHKQGEVKMLMSIIRRLQISTAVFVQGDPFANEEAETEVEPQPLLSLEP